MSSIEISNEDFNRLVQLIYNESGIHIHSGKMALLKSKIAKRMRQTQITSCNAYLEFLSDNKSEVVEFIDAVTTNHSFFFRENGSISYMVQSLEAKAQGRRSSDVSDRHFKIWCAACSTGDEPYSIAVQMMNHGLSFDILATDISHSVLNTAIKGIYSAERVKNIPVPLLHRYFQKGTGNRKGYVRVKKEVMTHVTYKKFNLVTDPIPDGTFDVVLCRNVMIYFDNEVTEKVINRLYHALKPGGFFIIGQSESLMNLDHPFIQLRDVSSTFQK